ncbi:hypothetical protein Nepgr_002613 [Nepenthes gracilis]|uniref:Protein kinase domain-containing protein n=1 Tax=Nepenthes gracilis TaxID=150966 RepID=A0AAD3P9U8_NEPGR|nr:hypothetical protein Nepgr_002613 [Nepenthes gracilis]
MDSIVLAIIGAVVSFVCVTLMFLLFSLICKIKPISQSQGRTVFNSSREADRSVISTDQSASFDPSLRHVSMAELIVATDNFNPKGVIGDGSFGFVYKAKLSSNGGVVVALKKLDPNAFQGHREFRAEMETLGKLRHRNIVKILGYCVSGTDRILIYEFVEKGSLDRWLYNTSSSEDNSLILSPLSWETRVKIIRGVADGLAFMHGLETPIVHRDIKASNVLLDSDFEAHIADFGLARRIEGSHSHVSTQMAGTMGYMPPEYKIGFTAATVKADVYSFGTLMFEVASAKRPHWPTTGEDEREVWLVEWAKKRIAGNKAVEIVDGSVPREKLRESEVEEFMRIADMCTREKPKERPAMSDVVEMLNAMATWP